MQSIIAGSNPVRFPGFAFYSGQTYELAVNSKTNAFSDYIQLIGSHAC